LAIENSGQLLVGSPPPDDHELAAYLRAGLARDGRALRRRGLLQRCVSWVFALPEAGELDMRITTQAPSPTHSITLAQAQTRYGTSGTRTVRVRLTRQGRKLLSTTSNTRVLLSLQARGRGLFGAKTAVTAVLR
jgi:hypothetical protein